MDENVEGNFRHLFKEGAWDFSTGEGMHTYFIKQEVGRRRRKYGALQMGIKLCIYLSQDEVNKYLNAPFGAIGTSYDEKKRKYCSYGVGMPTSLNEKDDYDSDDDALLGR